MLAHLKKLLHKSHYIIVRFITAIVNTCIRSISIKIRISIRKENLAEVHLLQRMAKSSDCVRGLSQGLKQMVSFLAKIRFGCITQQLEQTFEKIHWMSLFKISCLKTSVWRLHKSVLFHPCFPAGFLSIVLGRWVALQDRKYLMDSLLRPVAIFSNFSMLNLLEEEVLTWMHWKYCPEILSYQGVCILPSTLIPLNVFLLYYHSVAIISEKKLNSNFFTLN